MRGKWRLGISSLYEVSPFSDSRPCPFLPSFHQEINVFPISSWLLGKELVGSFTCWVLSPRLWSLCMWSVYVLCLSRNPLRRWTSWGRQEAVLLDRLEVQVVWSRKEKHGLFGEEGWEKEGREQRRDLCVGYSPTQESSPLPSIPGLNCNKIVVTLKVFSSPFLLHYSPGPNSPVISNMWFYVFEGDIL